MSVNLSINVLLSDMLTDRKKISNQREITLINVKKKLELYKHVGNIMKGYRVLFSLCYVFSKSYLHRCAQIHVFQYYTLI